ncbi:MAG: 16S rRNA (cytosine(1402)-N(4))-methyltransferase RsmH [Planctomycetales bacterium]|nr:16S rRNA (cytosine(1402)-N(4))-methyltransferase RsmH [Planctomycetales bacterium]
MSSDQVQHTPVLTREVIEWLDPRPGQTIVDGTFGGGGHTGELLKRVAPGGRLIAFDRDPEAVDRAEALFAHQNVTIVHGDFADVARIVRELGAGPVDGILLDLGWSAFQLADAERGFSFDIDGPLDLRYDPTLGEPAWRMLERLSAEHLADVIYHYGEERLSRRIARAIVERRVQRQPVRSARELAEVVRRAVPKTYGGSGGRIDPATRTFQALRIAVNGELESLETALKCAPDALREGGRIAVISFHSLEDRRVKQAFRDDCRYEVLTRRPVQASEAEQQTNPQSRSAKLRVARRSGELRCD